MHKKATIDVFFVVFVHEKIMRHVARNVESDML